MRILVLVARHLKNPLVVGSLLTSTSPAATADEMAELMEKARTAFNRADVVDAMRWYRMAAERGHVPAQIRLAQLLDYSEQNELAIGWYKKAVALNSAQAQYELAGMLSAGDGVEKNNERALELFAQSANQGYAPALRTLATAYEKGHFGLQPDSAKAIELIEKGIATGDTWSIERLARAYELGELGQVPDRAKAKSLRAQSGMSQPKEK